MPVRRLLPALMVGAAFLCSACSWRSEAREASTATQPVLRIVHAGGENASFTEPMEQALAASLPGVQIELKGTNASVRNLMMLWRGEADVVFTFSDAAYMASIGQIPELTRPFEEIRAIAGLPTRALQIVLAPGSKVRSVSDLRGRHVSLGPPGSGSALTSAFILSGFGMSLNDVRADRLEFGEGARKVIAGDLDAAFWNGTFPNANVAEALRHGSRLLEVTGPDIERFRSEYPFLKPSVVPAGVYPGLSRPVHTVGIDGILVCRASLDEQIVHEVTRALFELAARTDIAIPSLVRMNLSRASATPIPLHPGAARYYRERELLR